MAGRSRLGIAVRSALDPGVLKIAAPAYALPFLDMAAGLVGFPALASVWYLLFAPAVGLHALLALSVANRAAAPALTAPELQDLGRLGRQLSEGFREVGFTEGATAADDLGVEYAQLQPVLGRRRATDSLVVAQVPGLALDTYTQGLSVLADALELLRATRPSERERLEQEIATTEAELAQLKNDPAQAGRARIREERLESNRELLQLMNQQRERIDQLLFQAERCEASLRRTRLELAGMEAVGSEQAVSSVVNTLRLTLNHAKGVQEEMQRLASPPAS